MLQKPLPVKAKTPLVVLQKPPTTTELDPAALF
jgi:hypothetical protein